jgi:hypothetical protein
MKLTNPEKAKRAVIQMVQAYSELIDAYDQWDMMIHPFPVDYHLLDEMLRDVRGDIIDA